jgi:hypothetical protein
MAQLQRSGGFDVTFVEPSDRALTSFRKRDV